MNITTYPPEVLPEKVLIHSPTISPIVIIIGINGMVATGYYDFTQEKWRFNDPRKPWFELGFKFRWHYPITWQQANEPKREFGEPLRVLEFYKLLCEKDEEPTETIEDFKAAIELLKGGDGE